MGEVEDE
jgi:hypothetical protein